MNPLKVKRSDQARNSEVSKSVLSNALQIMSGRESASSHPDYNITHGQLLHANLGVAVAN